MLRTGTYRTPRGEIVHCHIDATGCVRCEIERVDGSWNEVPFAVLTGAVLLSDDPAWPCPDERKVPTFWGSD